MTKGAVCVNPVNLKAVMNDAAFKLFGDPERAEAINNVRPYIMDFEPLSKCAGSCAYCYASSTSAADITMSREKVLEIVDEAYALGVRIIEWCGGDPTLHPNWEEFLIYSAEKGIKNNLLSSGLISKQLAKRIADLVGNDVIELPGLNLATINQEDYNKVHTKPETLQQRVQGYRNLLEAGVPPDKIGIFITCTKPALAHIDETLDWLVDEMGCKWVCYVQYKTEGFACAHKEDWEASLSEITRALKYRADKLGQEWLRTGTSELAIYYCRCIIGVTYEGNVIPCLVLRDMPVGNIYKEKLTDIFYKNRDTILFNHEIKGYCGTDCENRDVCFGCRANAYHYIGDVAASDPKCFLNPEAPEFCF